MAWKRSREKRRQQRETRRDQECQRDFVSPKQRRWWFIERTYFYGEPDDGKCRNVGVELITREWSLNGETKLSSESKKRDHYYWRRLFSNGMLTSTDMGNRTILRTMCHEQQIWETERKEFRIKKRRIKKNENHRISNSLKRHEARKQRRLQKQTCER